MTAIGNNGSICLFPGIDMEFQRNLSDKCKFEGSIENQVMIPKAIMKLIEQDDKEKKENEGMINSVGIDSEIKTYNDHDHKDRHKDEGDSTHTSEHREGEESEESERGESEKWVPIPSGGQFNGIVTWSGLQKTGREDVGAWSGVAKIETLLDVALAGKPLSLSLPIPIPISISIPISIPLSIPLSIPISIPIPIPIPTPTGVNRIYRVIEILSYLSY